MRYSEFQLSIRRLSRENLIETKSDELSISALAQKESEVIESTILNQPNTQIAKARLLHEIDECLKDFSFFESHARRELDRAEKIQTELRERVIADAQNRNFRHIPAYWQIVRDIISGVEEGLSIYFKTLATYFPDELEQYDSKTLGYFLPYFSTHRKILKPPTPLRYELGSIESKLEQFEYWKQNIAPHIQTRETAAKFWGRPEHLLISSQMVGFIELGFVPEQIYVQYIEAWITDRKVIYKVSREQIRDRGLPVLVEELEKQITANIEFGIADNGRLIKSELAKCDQYNVDLKESDIELGVGGRYYFRTLYHEFYREYLLTRLNELKNAIPIVSKSDRAEVSDYSFEDYLTDEGKRIFPQIHHRYKDSMPSKLVPFLFAMADLGLITISPGSFSNQTHLHTHLQATFGKIGTRQAFNTSITLYNEGDWSKQQKIDQEKVRLRKYAVNQ